MSSLLIFSSQCCLILCLLLVGILIHQHTMTLSTFYSNLQSEAASQGPMPSQSCPSLASLPLTHYIQTTNKVSIDSNQQPLDLKTGTLPIELQHPAVLELPYGAFPLPVSMITINNSFVTMDVSRNLCMFIELCSIFKHKYDTRVVMTCNTCIIALCS